MAELKCYLSHICPHVQGKGLMDTYWVKSKKSGEASSQTMLNPFQRQKILNKSPKHLKPIISPTHSRPSTPPPPSLTMSTLLAPPPDGRLMSPKPDEWPIADHRLSQVEERHHMGDRRYTLPSVQCPPIVIQRQLAGPGGGGGLPLADASSLLDRRNTITTLDPREMQQAVIHSHPIGRPSVSSANTAWPLWNTNGVPSSPRESVAAPETPRLAMPSELSEYNLLHVRDSLTTQLPPLMEGGVTSPAQLSLFAAMAEETARQARRVADWAAYIAKAKSNSRTASSDRLSSSDHGSICRHGSSVDAFPEGRSRCPHLEQVGRGGLPPEKEREGSDAVFEALNGVCPVRHEAKDDSEQSSDGGDGGGGEAKHRGDPHSNCSIM